MYDFKNTEAAKGVSFLTPGVYPLQPNKVELGSFPKGTKYLAVTFTTEEDVEITEKFVLSEKAIGRLQYLHEGFFGKKCEKVFKSEDEVEAYFRKALTTKKIVKNVVIGGEISGNKVYANLPYTNFIVENDELEVGEFEEGSEEWKKFVKKRVNQNSSEVEGKDNGILNEADEDDTEEIGGKAKTTKAGKGAKAEKTTGKGGKTTKKDEPEEDSDDDMPW